MAATLSTMAMLSAKCINTSKIINPSKLSPSSSPVTKPIISIQNLPKQLINPSNLKLSSSMAIAGAMFSTLTTCDAAFALQQIADLAQGSDSRGLALLLPIAPAIAWVLFNILQPALNQLNRMRVEKAVVVGLGLGGGLFASGLMSSPDASASEFAMLADAAAAAAGSDSRGQLLLIVIAPAIGWVLYNILQPALNQVNRMRSD
ncbi:hypothetical protein ACFE04_023671 [Oxalis oulophora]